MGAREEPAIAEFVQVLADGLWGDFEALGEFVHADGAGLAGEDQDLLLAR